MILQKVLFTEKIDGLYSHSKGRVEYKNDNSVVFEKNAEWSTDAYLNAFSVGKWCTYCDISKISLHLYLKGCFIVRIIYAYAGDKKLCRKQIAGGRVEASEGSIVKYDVPMQAH